MKKLLLIPLLLLLSHFPAVAQQEQADSAEVLFPQSISTLNVDFANNRAQLKALLQSAEKFRAADSLAHGFTTISVIGAASPEGSVSFDRSLSKHRASSLYNYFINSGVIDSSSVDYIYRGRDWQGLRRLVENDFAVPSRSRVLDVLDSIISANGECEPLNATTLTAIKKLDGGVPYYYMYRHLFHKLRASKIIVRYNRFPIRPSIPSTAYIIVAEPLPSPQIESPSLNPTPVKVCKPFYMSLRTNLLYDALAVPNIGAELYLGKKWSVQANWSYGWWDNDHRHRYWRAYGGDLGLRRWFGHAADEKPLTGHHLGAFFGVVTYDFEFGGRGYMGGLPGRNLWDRCNYVAALEYGYSLPVARRLNLDFTLGLGYIGGKYIDYVPDGERYLYQRTRRLNWVGPVKAEVSLVWLIGCDNYNRR